MTSCTADIQQSQVRSRLMTSLLVGYLQNDVLSVLCCTELKWYEVVHNDVPVEIVLLGAYELRLYYGGCFIKAHLW